MNNLQAIEAITVYLFKLSNQELDLLIRLMERLK
jgi:hypothetical protein